MIEARAGDKIHEDELGVARDKIQMLQREGTEYEHQLHELRETVNELNDGSFDV